MHYRTEVMSRIVQAKRLKPLSYGMSHPKSERTRERTVFHPYPVGMRIPRYSPLRSSPLGTVPACQPRITAGFPGIPPERMCPGVSLSGTMVSRL